MEDRFKQFINNHRYFFIFYLLWFLFNLVVLVTRGKVVSYWSDKFWPFGSFNLAAYDKTEFIFYLIVPIVLLGIWKLINKDAINYIQAHKTKRNNQVTKEQEKIVFAQHLSPKKRIKKSGIITLLIISIIIWFIFYSVALLMEMGGQSSLEFTKTGNALLLILRLAAVVNLTNKAKEFKVNQWGWGIFGFFFPIISLIVMLVKINKSNRLFKMSQLANEGHEVL